MATQRFDTRKEISGKWTIFDVFTGLPVILGYEPTIGLELEDARDLAVLMNALDREHRATKAGF
jgi:hypothetical protein